jgi:prophage regulatory protein
MSEAANRRLLRLPEVKEKVGLSRTAIYRLIAEGQFPRQVCIGPRTVAWCQEDLEAWIEQRIQGALSEPAGSRLSPTSDSNSRPGDGPALLWVGAFRERWCVQATRSSRSAQRCIISTRWGQYSARL